MSEEVLLTTRLAEARKAKAAKVQAEIARRKAEHQKLIESGGLHYCSIGNASAADLAEIEARKANDASGD